MAKVKPDLVQTKGKDVDSKKKKKMKSQLVEVAAAGKGSASKSKPATKLATKKATKKKSKKHESSDEDEDDEQPSAKVTNEDDVEEDSEDEDENEGGDEDEDEGENEAEAEAGDEDKDGSEGSKRVTKKKEPRALRKFRLLDVKASLDIHRERGTEQIYQTIRILARHITEHCDPTRILTDGLVMTNLGDTARKPSEIHDKFNQIILAEMLWPQVCKWLPELETHAQAITNDTNLLCHIGNYILGVTKKTRSDDLPRVKAQIIDLADIQDTDKLLRDKGNRGFNSITTGRLLCPVSDIDEFDADPAQYCRLARAGEKMILSDDWFIVCYDERLRKRKDPKAGLFRNMVGIKCYKLIFTGKGSAMDEYYKASKGKTPVATKARLERVTIGSIVHVYLLMRFALNSQGQWQDTDGPDWNGAAFARSVFDAAFESPKWAAELEDCKVFGRGREDSDELQLKRKSTTLALFKQSSERTMRRQMTQDTRKNSSMDGLGDRINEDNANSPNTANNQDRANDNLGCANDNLGRADHANDDRGPQTVQPLDNAIIPNGEHPAKRSIAQDPGDTDRSEQPNKRIRLTPGRQLEPQSPVGAVADHSQTTARDDVEEIFVQRSPASCRSAEYCSTRLLTLAQS
ncbi:hypothetical protein LXA43DRAFT_1090981 [Ganoderma leucocontextum]|nr:hypothetical protein LXA43DRAFT_1090981 [Ganoderma leucocontextum]